MWGWPSELRNWSLQAAVDNARHSEAEESEAASDYAMQRMDSRPSMACRVSLMNENNSTDKMTLAKPPVADSPPVSELGAPAALSYVDTEGVSDGGFLERSSAVCPATIAKKRSTSQRDLLTNNIEMAPAGSATCSHHGGHHRAGSQEGRPPRASSTAGRPGGGGILGLERRLTEEPNSERLSEESTSSCIMGRRSFKSAAVASRFGVLARGNTMASVHTDEESSRRGAMETRTGHNGNGRHARGGGGGPAESVVALRVETKLEELDLKVSGVDDRVAGLQAMVEKLVVAVQSIDRRMGGGGGGGGEKGGGGGEGGRGGGGRLPSMMTTPALPYPRHEGGAEESAAVLSSARARRRPASSAKVVVQV